MPRQGDAADASTGSAPSKTTGWLRLLRQRGLIGCKMCCKESSVQCGAPAPVCFIKNRLKEAYISCRFRYEGRWAHFIGSVLTSSNESAMPARSASVDSASTCVCKGALFLLLEGSSFVSAVLFEAFAESGKEGSGADTLRLRPTAAEAIGRSPLRLAGTGKKGGKERGKEREKERKKTA
jgi:hypothetical protein